MAEEIRVLKGDTYDVIVSVRDSNNSLIGIVDGGWGVEFESDTISKNSVDNPGEFIIEQAPYTKGQVVINLTSLETGSEAAHCRKHFKVRLFKGMNPPIRKTVATGDLYFIDEA